MDLFCRITCSYATFTPVVQLIDAVCDKLVIYEHNSNVDNTHIHMYIEKCTVSTDTLKNYCKRFGITGGPRGTGWSFKSAHDAGCIVYMSKGDIEPSYVKGFTTDEITSYRESWQPNKKGKYQTKLQYIVRETPSQAKKRKNDYLQEMISELGDHQGTQNSYYYVDEKVVRVIIKVLNDNHVIFGRYTIRDYYDTLCSRKFTDTFVNSMISFLSPKN